MLDPGVTLGGRYTLVALIARGGMGEVWRADDTVLGRRVAVKVLLPNLAGDPGFAARFRAEARAMAALSHPGIVEIYDYGQTDGIAYLVMQFVEGEPLNALVGRTGPLAPEHALRLLVQAADAIDAAHRQGIVHRDVKPSNLLLRTDGRLALTDFGIARIVAADRLTAADQILGTASYLAPEQVTGDAVGPATDVYALGVVTFELLTGGRPFRGDTPLAVALQHVHDQPPELPGSIPAPVRALVMRAMAKNPAERWPGAGALAQAAATALTALAGQTSPAQASPHDAGTPAPAAGISSGSTPAGPSHVTPSSAATDRPGRDAARRPGRRVLAAAAAALVLAAAVAFVLAPGGAQDQLAQQPGTSPPAGGAATADAVAATGAPTRGADPTTGTAPTSHASATPRRGTPAASASPSRPAANPASPAAASSPAPTTRTVPNMYGWREVEVKAELTRLGLDARITYRATPDKCYAIEQSPVGGTVVPAGSAVEIVVATATGVCKVV